MSMTTREGKRQLRRAVRALEKIAEGHLRVAEGCREYDGTLKEQNGLPSVWAGVERERALGKAAEVTTMAVVLREGLGEDADEKARRPARAAGERQIAPAKGRVCKGGIYGERTGKASGKTGGRAQ